MEIDNEFSIRDVVYLKTDEDQKEHIVTAIWIRDDGLAYELSCGIVNSCHYDFEISTVKYINGYLNN